MAILSSDGKYVTVEKGDTLSAIALKYLGSASKYKQLAAIKANNIVNPNLIYPGQKIYLSSDGASSSTSSSDSNAVDIKQFGLISTSDDELFATWTWSKEEKTESYKVVWTYTLIGGETFTTTDSIPVDEEYPEASRETTYNIPAGAQKVTFKIKPISEKTTVEKVTEEDVEFLGINVSELTGWKKSKTENEEVTYFSANWSTIKTHTVENPLDTPGQPSVELDGLKLTAELDDIDTTVATHIKFQLVKNDTIIVETTKAEEIDTDLKRVSHEWAVVDNGCEYKVRCQALKGSLTSEWSAFSSAVSTVPNAPSGITTYKAVKNGDDTRVYLEWDSVTVARRYDIEYTTDKTLFDISSDTTKVSTEGNTAAYYITNIELGKEYFFRVRAVNDAGESEWTEPVSLTLGTAPAAPTTWSSTTTAIVGEVVKLYWVHNSEDGSSETFADLELYIDGVLLPTSPIENTNEEDEKDATKYYDFDTSSYTEGTVLQWRVRTKGITDDFGDWSIQRKVDIYAQPTLKLSVVDGDDNYLTEIASFPFYISAIPGPKTQKAIGYHLSITADESYNTVNTLGNRAVVNAGDEVYSKYFDTNYDLMVAMTAGNVDLEKNISYTITCTVTMNSGLSTSSSVTLPVTWSEVVYSPNAEIAIDYSNYAAYIKPYCEKQVQVYKEVIFENEEYTVSDNTLSSAWGERVAGAYTTTGQLVYQGSDDEGNELYFCQIEETEAVENVLLSVYRREFDGTFTEIATGIDNSKNTAITDPHPALDYARYRIVAVSTETGAVGHCDLPGYPVGGTAVIIQWNEAWSSFETESEDAYAQPSWSGSLLMLPYNIDVSDSRSPDVSLVEYIGRSHPVSYYGTQRGETSNWNLDIEKSDKETLYGLRRLAIWMGDVYVREPSGSGYWAHVTVSFSQKHRNLTIPVTLSITRVEGGM